MRKRNQKQHRFSRLSRFICVLSVSLSCLCSGNSAIIMAQDHGQFEESGLDGQSDLDFESIEQSDQAVSEDLAFVENDGNEQSFSDAEEDPDSQQPMDELDDQSMEMSESESSALSEKPAFAFEKKRNLLEENWLALSAEQIEEIVNIHLQFQDGYHFETGDWFELSLPAGIDLHVLNELCLEGESGFRIVQTETSLEVYLVDEQVRPDAIRMSIKQISDQLAGSGSLIWIYSAQPNGSITLDFSYLFKAEGSAQSFNYPAAIGCFNPSLSAFGQKIEAVKDTYASGLWDTIKSVYGTSGQQKVLNEVRRILTTKGLTSYDSRSLVEIANKPHALKIINKYLCDRISYDINTTTHGKDQGQTAYSALIDRKTVCAGYSHAFFLLANALEIKTYIVVGDANGGSGWGGHGWNISLLGNYYYVTDVTFNDGSTQYFSYFLLGKDAMNKKNDHRLWDPPYYPGSELYSSRLAAANYSAVSSITAKLNNKALSDNQTINVDAGKKISIPLTTASGSKYSLTWTTSDSSVASVNNSYGSGATLTITGKKNGKAVVKIFSPDKRQLTLNINVVNSTFTIRYDANGGSGSMKDTVVKYGVNTRTTSNAFTRTGYIFQHWYVKHQDGSWICTKRDADNHLTWKNFKSLDQAKKEGFALHPYSNGTTVAKTASTHGEVIRFVAQWKPVTFTIQYDPNGGTGSMASTAVTYGVSVATRKNTFVRPGYSFDCWHVQLSSKEWICTKKDAQGKLIWKNFKSLDQAKSEGFAPHPYANGTTVAKTSAVQGDVVKFIAQWKKNPEETPSDPPAQNPSQQPSEKPSQVESVPMHRLYNPNSGEHFYTANTNEKNNLVRAGWKYEGTGWIAPKTSKTPVYRLYNANAGDHHYTKDASEKDSLIRLGWKYEGIGWYSDDSKAVPLYRQYNPNAKAGSHNYTTNKEENDFLVKNGWIYEGIGWYGMK